MKACSFVAYSCGVPYESSYHRIVVPVYGKLLLAEFREVFADQRSVKISKWGWVLPKRAHLNRFGRWALAWSLHDVYQAFIKKSENGESTSELLLPTGALMSCENWLREFSWSPFGSLFLIPGNICAACTNSSKSSKVARTMALDHLPYLWGRPLNNMHRYLLNRKPWFFLRIIHQGQQCYTTTAKWSIWVVTMARPMHLKHKTLWRRSTYLIKVKTMRMDT